MMPKPRRYEADEGKDVTKREQHTDMVWKRSERPKTSGKETVSA